MYLSEVKTRNRRTCSHLFEIEVHDAVGQRERDSSYSLNEKRGKDTPWAHQYLSLELAD